MKSLYALVPLITALSCSVAHAATVYDLSGDFSNASNPNGVWSFTQGSAPLAHYFPSTANSINPALTNGYWGTGSDLNNNTPEVAKVTANGSTTSVYTDADFLTGDVILHSTNPGAGAPVFINWTAPAAGTIDVSGLTWYAHSPVARSNEFLITLGASTLTTGVVSNNIHTGRSNALAFSFSDLAVLAGTVLSISYTPTAGQTFGSIAGLSEAVTFTASPVPESSTWMLMLAGLGVLGSLVRQRQAIGRA
jgi:hypothetical protein